MATWNGYPERRTLKRRSTDPVPPDPVERRSGVERRSTVTLTPTTLDGDPLERTRVGVRRSADQMLSVVAAKRAGGHATTIDNGTVEPPVTPPSNPAFDGYAELPRSTPSYTFSLPIGGVTHAPANAAELQTLLSGGTLNGQTLQRGDVIQLTAGQQYTSAGVSQQVFPRTDTMTTRAGASSNWIYVVTSALGSLPQPGFRVNDSHKASMPVFRQMSNGGNPAIRFANNADRYALVGIAADGGSVTATTRIVEFGALGASTIADLPEELVMDRCHVSATRANNCSRTVALACGPNWVVRDSNLYCTGASGIENQAIGGWQFTGPGLIENNYLVAGGENVLFGGSDPAINGILPVDITIRRNYMYKPLTWNEHHASWDGVNIVCKNLFELKNGVRILVEDNVLENFWGPDQNFALNLKTVNQSGGQTWSETSNVTVRYNRWIRVSSWATVTPQGATSVPAYNITLRHNYVQYMGLPGWAGTYATQLGGSDGTIVDRNTIMADPTGGTNGMCTPNADGAPDPTGGFTNNIIQRGGFGWKAAGTAEGNNSITYLYGDTTRFGGNVLIGASSGIYPTGNSFPATIAAVGFTDAANSDFSLTPSSPYIGAASDGGVPGADIAAVLTRTAGCVTGSW